MNNNKNPISVDELEDIKLLLDLKCKEHIIEREKNRIENSVNEPDLISFKNMSKNSLMKK